jgi:hypothetical protein
MRSPRGEPIRLQLELRSYDERVEGNVGDAHGDAVPFSSWLELIAAIQRLTGRARDTDER